MNALLTMIQVGSAILSLANLLIPQVSMGSPLLPATSIQPRQTNPFLHQIFAAARVA
jgi:hypothetical protein